jgi:hypothetical protein
METRGYGSISYRVYWEYLRAGGVSYLGNISLLAGRRSLLPR